MTIPRISLRDLEALSAYLDDELAPEERSRLESRLRADAVLRSALEDFRRTRAVLRSQPRLRAPRNFTLTPHMAGMRTGRRPVSSAFASLRLASVLATIFFLVVFVGDLVVSRLQPMQVPVDQSAQRAVPPIWGLGGGGGGSDETGFAVPLEKAVEVPATEEGLVQETVPASASTQEPGLVVTPVEGDALVTPTPTIVMEPSYVQTDTLPGREVEANVVPGERPYPAAPPGRGTGWSWSFLRALEILLALLAIGAGTAALWLRRSRFS